MEALLGAIIILSVASFLFAVLALRFAIEANGRAGNQGPPGPPGATGMMGAPGKDGVCKCGDPKCTPENQKDVYDNEIYTGFTERTGPR